MTRMTAFSFVTLLFAGGCTVSRGFYDPCDSPSDCGGGTECYTIAFEVGRDGQMCTDACEINADCPFGGVCFELVGDPSEGQRVCYERCRDALDCPVDFLCADAVRENPVTGEDEVIDRICLPE